MNTTGNHSIAKLQAAIDYIEDHIHEKLNLDTIATAVNLSKHHLHRIFRAMTHEKLMDYTRNRKLTRSIHELLHTNLKLIDIAYEYGFEYEQSYIRSFYRLFGMTPTYFRTSKPQIPITDKMTPAYLQSLEDNSLLINPRIVIKPDFLVVGTKHTLRFADEDFFDKVNQLGNQFFYMEKQQISHVKNHHTYIGIIKYIENVMDYKYYITATEVSRVEKVPSGMISYFVPSQKYAVFTYIGLHHPRHTTLKNLLCMYEYIFETWLPKSGYIFSGLYQMEGIDLSIAREDYCEIHLYIPIGSTAQPSPPMVWLDLERACAPPNTP